ncbi:hypothetical protein FA95DRAFT_864631 [Auriscalpium vulgare]|uniref:Uncharacterized protein n=1 Tax=Auriscalpium vulgare TaxID=40419 RepID=A0ACB8R966_9AGAM|nr:hypothetical protein FA95DRAFT_864631 [Auriscalpium vulgare]
MKLFLRTPSCLSGPTCRQRRRRLVLSPVACCAAVNPHRSRHKGTVQLFTNIRGTLPRFALSGSMTVQHSLIPRMTAARCLSRASKGFVLLNLGNRPWLSECSAKLNIPYAHASLARALEAAAILLLGHLLILESAVTNLTKQRRTCNCSSYRSPPALIRRPHGSMGAKSLGRGEYGLSVGILPRPSRGTQSVASLPMLVTRMCWI